MEKFEERFVRLRKENNLTQEDVANKLGISPQAVSKWENGISMPDISLLVDIASMFNVSVDTLLGKETENHEVTLSNNENKKPIEKMALRLFINSNDGDVVKINIPVPLLKIALETGMKAPQINGKANLENIDFKQIYNLIEQGVIGELMTVDAKDGDKIRIVVE